MDKKNTKTIAEEIIERSGNSFHSRVVELLREEKWKVLVSPYYSDNFTDKPREIDIIAEKLYPVKDVFHTNILGYINIRLLIECKYVAHDTVFWFDDKDIERAIKRTMQDTGLDHPARNGSIEKHHYLSNVRVAKLVASNAKKNEENEAINRAINQNLNALAYYRNRNDLRLTSGYEEYEEHILKCISYPLIVVNSFEKFHQTLMTVGSKPQTINTPFQLEVNYAYTDKSRKGHNEYFLIDVMSIDMLSTFLSECIGTADVPVISQNLAYEERANRLQNQRTDSSSYDTYSSM